MEKVTHEQAFLVAALCSVVKKRERTRRWRVAHPEKDLESSRKWKINNPDKVRESGRRRSRRWRNNLEKTGDTNRKKKTCAENPKNARDRAARNALTSTALCVGHCAANATQGWGCFKKT